MVVTQSNDPARSIAEVAKEHGLNANMIARWRRASERARCVVTAHVSSSQTGFLCLRGAGYIQRRSRSVVQLRLDVQDDPCDRVVVCGLRRELDLGEGNDTENDDQDCSRRGDAGKVFHRDLTLMV
jgi:transposase-like protein